MKSSSKVLAFLMTILLLAGIAAGCKGTVTPDDNGTNTNSGSNNNGTNNGTNSGSTNSGTNSGSNNGNSGGGSNSGSGNTNSNNGGTTSEIVFSVSYSQENDIQVTSMKNGNMLIFTSEECDLYTWRLNDQEYANTKSCSINLGNYKKGTYSLSLEAFKDSKWYSFFAQIIVE